MDSKVKSILETIEHEIEHARSVEQTFLCALGLFESHYQKRHSELLEHCPDYIGLSLSDDEIAKIKQTAIRFIEELPNHGSITAAIWLLSLSRDQSLKSFFIKHLRLHLGWRPPTP